MTAKGSCCCCSKCGVQLPAAANGCCLCVCDEICVTVRNTSGGDCNCEIDFVLIHWDHDECAYVGTATCGSLTIDMRFDVKKCSDGTCRLCLTSTCLGLTGLCGNAGCKEFAPGHNGDCGKYLRDCDQSGGWNETWNVNATGCLPVELSITCPSIEIHVECIPRINPAGIGLTRLCKDCDCVCECVRISYLEGVCIDTDIACWDDQWSATLVLDLDPGGFPCTPATQTVTVEIIRDEPTGCCYWRVTISKGVFAEGYPGEGTTIALIKTACPEIDIELQIDIGGGETGTVTVSCQTCGDADCAGCGLWVSKNAGLNVGTITTVGCGTTEAFTGLTLNGAQLACRETHFVSHDTGTTFPSVSFDLNWNGATGRWDWAAGLSIFDANCAVVNPVEIEYVCTPCYFKLVLEWTVQDLGGCLCGTATVTTTLELDLSANPECIP